MGLFEGIQGALSSAYNAATSAAGSVVRTVSGAVASAASAIPKISLPSVSLPSFNAPTISLPSIPNLTQAGAAAIQAAQQSAAAVANSSENIAKQTALAAGKSVEYATAAAANEYRKNNGLPLIDLSIFDAPVKAVTSGITGAGQAIAAAPEVIPSFVAPTVQEVTAQIAKAASTVAAPSVATAGALGKAAGDAGSAIAGIPAVLPKISLPTVQTFTAPAASLLSTKIDAIPGLTGPGTIIPNAPSTGNLYDQVIGTRSNLYDAGGETFAKGWEGGDALGIGEGAGIYGATAAVDFIAPLDGINLANKIATGRMNEITSDEWINGGIDVALIGVGIGTGGTGYVAGKGLLKGSKFMLAADKAAVKIGEKVAATKGAKEAAEVGALAAIGATGGKMIKLGSIVKDVSKLIKPEVKAVKKVEKPAVKAVVKEVKAVEKPAAKTVIKEAEKPAAKAVIQKAPTVSTKNLMKKASTAAAVEKPIVKATVKPEVKAAAKDVTAVAPASSILSAAGTEEKAIAKDVSTAAQDVKSVEKAAVESAAPGSSLLKNAGLVIGAGLTGIGLASYLGGSGADQAASGADNGAAIGDSGQPVTADTTGGDLTSTDPTQDGTQLTPDENAALNDQIGQIQDGIDNGTIDPTAGQTAQDALAQQIDDSGGNFDAAVGSDTPYQSVENAAQDATRAIPGDPLAWFRQHGLAAPVMGGLIIVILLVAWWAYKKYFKHGSGSTHGRRGKASGASGAGSSSGNKIVVV